MIDLATDGLRGAKLTRGNVMSATRRVMLSAHRAGWTWSEVHALLTDTRRRRLATQISTGRGGRPIGSRSREDFLRRLWAEAERFAAQRPAWSRTDVIDFVERARLAIEAATDLDNRERRILDVVVDVAISRETSRPAVPVHLVAERTGLPYSTAHWLLRRLADQGVWLSLAKAGDRRSRRANLYNLAPALAETYRGTSSPMSKATPISNTPMSKETAEMDQITLTREQIVAALGEAAFAALLERAVPSNADQPTHLRLVAGEVRKDGPR